MYKGDVSSMIENEIREKIKLESVKHLNKIAQVPNKSYDCFDCEQLINVVFRDLFSFSIRQDGFGKSSTTKVMTSPIGFFYGFRNLTMQEKKIKLAAIHVGDILFFHTQSLQDNTPTKDNYYPGHLGLYLGNNIFIHAKDSSKKVILSNLEEEDYLEILIGYKDLLPYILEIEEYQNTYSL